MKIAIFQSACGGMTPAERLNRLRTALAAQSVDLIVCPELFISGYNVGEDLESLAQPADGPWFEEMSQLAQDTETCVVYGYPERDNGTLYNAAACIAPDGRLTANHRKRANSPGSFEETYFTPGDRMTAFTYQGVKIAVLICYEVEFPETMREAAQQGAHLVIVPTALVEQWDVVASKVVPARAFENGVWLAYANHAGEENGFTYLGGSRIVAPDGTEAATAGRNEDLIVAEIDTLRVETAQARLPYLRDVSKFQNSSGH